MPPKSGKTPDNLKANYNAFVGKMVGPKTQAGMAKVLSIGMTGAKELAPLEYGNLINSAFRNIEKTANGWRGVAGFTVYYALPLHEKTDWNPRPPQKKQGPAWNPNATPKFLERGFTDANQIALMQEALKSSYQ